MPSGNQGGTVSAHQMRDAWANDRHAQFLFKAAQHTVIAESSSLYDNLCSQIFLAFCTDDLIQSIFYHTAAQAG